MAIQDDVRRLSQLASIYLAHGFIGIDQSLTGQVVPFVVPFSVWYKGRLQQANDGNWIFRSISMDGTIVGFQLGSIDSTWTSIEDIHTGLVVRIQRLVIGSSASGAPSQLSIDIRLAEQLPQEIV
jgi:hypothetical protein